MPGQSDGSIIIDTELDSDGFKAGSADLLNAIKSLSEEIKNLGQTLKGIFADPMAPKVDTKDAEDKISALEAEIQELKNALNGAGSAEATPQVDFGGAVNKSSALQRSVDAVSSSVDRLEPTFQKAMTGSESAIASFDGRVTVLEDKIAELRNQLETIGQTKYPTDEFKEISDGAEKAGQKLQTLLDKQDKMQALGVKENSKAWQGLQYDIQAAEAELNRYEKRKAAIEAAGNAYQLGSDMPQFASMESALDAAASRLAEMRSGVDSVRNGTKESESWMRRLASAAGAVVKNISKAATKKLVSGIKSAASHMAKMLSHSKSMRGQFSGLISGAKKFALSLLGARGIWALLRKAVSAYMEQNQQLSATLSSCWSSIGNLLGPIITKVINLVAQAVAYVTAFLKLFGIVGKSTTKAIGSAGSAAKKETKELQRQLAAFDELNILTDNKSDGDSGSGGGGTNAEGNLPSVELPDWAKLIAEQLKAGDWAAAATTLAEQLNAMVASVDWAGVGQKIGYYLNGALTFLATFIKKFDWKALGSDLGIMMNNIITSVDWSNLGVILVAKWSIPLQLLTGFFKTFDGSAFSDGLCDFIMGAVTAVPWVELAKELATSLNRIVNEINWDALGTALAAGIDTGLSAISTAITTFDWFKLGTSLAESINKIIENVDWSNLGIVLGAKFIILVESLGGLFSKIDWRGLGKALSDSFMGLWNAIDWAQAGTALSDGVKGVLDFINSALEETDWQKIGSDIAAFIAAIDWSGLAASLAEGIGAALGGLAALLYGLLKNAWEDTKEYFSQYIEEAGGNIIEGLWKGIDDACRNVGNWIVEHIFQPFIDGFKKAFGIHSPSTVMAEQGGYIVEGLLQGITDTWNSIVEFFSTALGSITATLSDWAGKAKTTISDWASGVKSTFTKWASDTKSKVTTWAANTKTNISTWAANAKSTITTWASTTKSKITTWASTTKNSITTWGANVHSTLSGKMNTIKTTLSSGFEQAKNSITTKMNSAMDTIKGQDWHSVGTNICDGIKNGINAGWTWLKTTIGNLASGLVNTAKKVLDINSPSRVFRDEVGIYIGEGIGEGIIDSESSVLKSVSGVADAIADEFNAGEYKIGGIVPTAEVNGALTSFSDKIADSFSSMLDRLQAIAERVTFTAPVVASSVVPYQAAAVASAGGSGSVSDTITASNDELASVIIQAVTGATAAVVNAIQEYSGTTVNLDASSLTDRVVSEINRKTRMNGKSPLLI